MFKNRPLSLAFLCFAIVSVLCFGLAFLPSFLFSILLLSASAVTLVFYIFRKRRRLFLIFICLLASFISAFSSAFLFHAPRERLSKNLGEAVVLEGYVVKKVLQNEERSVYDVRLERINDERSNDSVRIKCSYSTSLEIGERFRISVMGSEFSVHQDYDEGALAVCDGIFAVFASDKEEDLTTDLGFSTSVFVFFSRARTFLSDFLQQCVGGEEGRLATALLLGDRSTLSDPVVLAFRRCGISHLLALSGLHVSILIAFLSFVLNKISVARWIRTLLVIVLSFSYLLLTGCSPSTVRAVLMVSVLSVAFLARGEYDSLTSLLGALFLILLITPYAAGDLGMWMSFLAAGSIIVFFPPLNAAWTTLSSKWNLSSRLIKLLSSLVLSFLVGAVANLGLLLVQAMAFGEISLLSIPATMILSPLLSAVLVLSIFCCFGLPVGFFCRTIASFMLAVANQMSGIPKVLLPLDDPLSFGLVIAVTLLLLAILIFKLRHVCIWILVTLSLSLLLIPSSFLFTSAFHGELKAAYLSEGGGEAIVFSREGECVVFALSEKAGNTAYQIIDKTREERCTEIDALVFSTYSNSYKAYLQTIVSNIKVHKIVLPEPTVKEENYILEALSQIASDFGIPVSYNPKEDLFDELSIRLFIHGREKNENADFTLIVWSDGERRLAYTNVAFLGSRKYKQYLKDVKSADAVIVGADGYVSSDPPKLRMQNMDARLVIFAGRDMESMVRKNLKRIPLVFGNAEYTFD